MKYATTKKMQFTFIQTSSTVEVDVKLKNKLNNKLYVKLKKQNAMVAMYYIDKMWPGPTVKCSYIRICWPKEWNNIKDVGIPYFTTAKKSLVENMSMNNFRCPN